MLTEQAIREIQHVTGVNRATAELIAVAHLPTNAPQRSMIPLADCLSMSFQPSFAQSNPMPQPSGPQRQPEPLPSVSSLPSCGCAMCDGVGFYKLAVPLGHPQFGKLLPCTCLLAVREQRNTALLDVLSSQLQRYQNCRLESFDLNRPIDEPLAWLGQVFSPIQQRAALKEAHHKAVAYATNPRGWLYLYGPPGSGKTRLAASNANAFRARQVQATYGRVQALLDWLKAGFRDGELISYDQRLRALEQTPLLVLDDLGTEQGSAWERVQIENLLNERYNRELPTVLTSNRWRDELPTLIADRIAEMAQVVWLLVGSHRRTGLHARELGIQPGASCDPWDRGEGEGV